MKSRRILLLYSFLLAGLSSYGQDILFVGNSIFYLHDVPGKLDSIARIRQRILNVRDISKPGYRIHHHLEDQASIQAIQEKHWDYVILLGYSNQLKGWGVPAFDSLFRQYYDTLVMVEPYSPFIPASFRKPDIKGKTARTRAISKPFSHITVVPFGQLLDFVLDKYPDFRFSDDEIHLNIRASRLLANCIFTFLFPDDKRETAFVFKQLADSCQNEQ